MSVHYRRVSTIDVLRYCLFDVDLLMVRCSTESDSNSRRSAPQGGERKEGGGAWGRRDDPPPGRDAGPPKRQPEAAAVAAADTPTEAEAAPKVAA